MQAKKSKSNQKIGQVGISALWTLSSNMVDKLIGIVSMAFLARLLTPHDFGLVAIAGSIVAFATLLNAFGFDWALVHHSKPTKSDYNSAWTLRILFGIAASITLIIAAPISVKVFHQTALLPIILVMAFSILIESFENIGIVDFRRNFTFHREFILRFVPKVASFIIGVSVAFILHSYWALVLGSLAYRLIGTLMSYIMHDFRPRLTLKNASGLFYFSIWLFLDNIIGFLRSCFANIFIGHSFGPSFTGVYSLSNEIAHLSITELAAPINRAAFSSYVQNSSKLDMLQEGYLTTASIIWMIALPATVGIFSTSNEIVAILLGQQWTEAVSILRLLAVGSAGSLMVANTHYVFWALGLTKVSSIRSGFSLVIMVVFSLILAPPLGIYGVALAYLLASFLVVPLNFYLLGKMIGVSFGKLWKRVWRSCIAAGVMLIILQLTFIEVPIRSSLEAIVPLVLKVCVGSGLYATLLVGLWIISGHGEGPERVAIGTIKAFWFRENKGA